MLTTLLLLLMAASLAAVAVTALIVLLQLQKQWMRGFGEHYGVNLSTDVKPAIPEVTAVKQDGRQRLQIPVPGADMLRKSRTQ
jgi:hypothetical protein